MPLPTNRAEAIAQHAEAAKKKAEAKRLWGAACAERDFANADRLQAEMHDAARACEEAARNRSRFCF